MHMHMHIQEGKTDSFFPGAAQLSELTKPISAKVS
jgi:hypothetical protein